MGLCGEDHKKLMDRLSRIEGQVRGIRKMVENDRDCMDVLKQVAAVNGALRGVGMVVLQDHLKGCVAEAFRSSQDNDTQIEQVISIFNKFSR